MPTICKGHAPFKSLSNRLLIATDAVSVAADFSSSFGLFYPPGNCFYATQQWVASQGFINYESRVGRSRVRRDAVLRNPDHAVWD